MCLNSSNNILGNISCPLTAYIATATSCHSNWLFVGMQVYYFEIEKHVVQFRWIQRSIHVSYPMSIIQSGRLWEIITNPRKLILYTGILSYTSQVYLLCAAKNNSLFSYGFWS